MKSLSSASAETRREAIEAIHRHAWPAIWSSSRKATYAKRQVDQLFERLGHLLEKDADEAVRYEAAYVLSRWWDRRAVRALLRLFGRETESARLRGQAAEGIGDLLAFLEPSDGALRSVAIAALREALGDSSPEVRFWTVRALGVLRATEARAALEKIAREDDAVCPHMWSVNDEAADAIAFIETGTWPDRLRPS